MKKKKIIYRIIRFPFQIAMTAFAFCFCLLWALLAIAFGEEDEAFDCMRQCLRKIWS